MMGMAGVLGAAVLCAIPGATVEKYVICQVVSPVHVGALFCARVVPYPNYTLTYPNGTHAAPGGEPGARGRAVLRAGQRQPAEAGRGPARGLARVARLRVGSPGHGGARVRPQRPGVDDPMG